MDIVKYKKRKLVFLGDQNSGKTAILERFVDESFKNYHEVNKLLKVRH